MYFAWLVDHIFSPGLVVYLDVLLCSLVGKPTIVHFRDARLLPLDRRVNEVLYSTLTAQIVGKCNICEVVV